MSRTYGVSIFIGYCTAPRDTEKVKGEERDIQLINMNEASSCLAGGYCVPCSPRKESSACQGPPLPSPTHILPIAEFEQFSATSAKSEDGLHLGA